MDCEQLKYQPITTGDLQGRHKNLQATPKTASIVKLQHPKYIPHEPVRGAVKPVSFVPSTAPSSGSKMTKASLNALSYKAAVPSQFNNQSVPISQRHTPHSEGENTLSTITVSNKSSPTVRSIKTIPVPIYQAPGHLHIETYRTMQRQQLKNQVTSTLPESLQTLGSAKQTECSTSEPADAIITMETLSSKETVLDMEDGRRVEGKTNTMVEQLNQEINKLKEQLQVQTGVSHFTYI